MKKNFHLLFKKFFIFFSFFSAIFTNAIYSMEKQKEEEPSSNFYEQLVRYGDSVLIKNAKIQKYAGSYYDENNKINYLVGVDSSKLLAFKILSTTNKTGQVNFGDEIYFEYKDNKDNIFYLGNSGMSGGVFGASRNFIGPVPNKNMALKFKFQYISRYPGDSPAKFINTGKHAYLQVIDNTNKDNFFRFNVSFSTSKGGPEIFYSEALGFLAPDKDTKDLIIEKQRFFKDLSEEEQNGFTQKINKHSQTISKYFNLFDCKPDVSEYEFENSYNAIKGQLNRLGNSKIISNFNDIYKFAKNLLLPYNRYGNPRISELKVLADFSQWPPITKELEEAITTALRKLDPTIYYSDSVRIKNFKTQKNLTSYEKEKLTYLVGQVLNLDKKKQEFSIIPTQEKSQQDEVKFGDVVYFKLKSGKNEALYIGEIGTSLLYGKKRTLLGLVSQEDALKFKILNADLQKTKAKPILINTKMLLNVVDKSGKTTNEFLRVNIDASTFKGGQEIFISEDSKLMTKQTINGSKELVFIKIQN
jgi:hypothetical protein